MRIAIMGTGSLGTIIGAHLSKGVHQVECIDVNTDHIHALNRNGATVVGTVNLKASVKAITPNEMTGIYDLVLLLTKQVYNKSVLLQLQAHMNEASILLSLQNGVPEESLIESLGADRIIGGSVEFGATWVKPGVSQLTSDKQAFSAHAFQIGELDGQMTDRVNQVKTVLEDVGGTIVSNNLIGTKWSKLLVNVAMSGMSAALGCTYGDILNNEAAVTSAVMLADETLKVGYANNIQFSELAGVNVGIFSINEDKSNLPRVIQIAKQAFGPQALLKASMLQDLEKGLQTEVDYINGYISTKGTALQVPTPVNDLVTSLIKQAEETKQLPGFDENIKAFESLLNKEMAVH